MKKNVNIGSVAKFTFSDSDGNVVAYFRMNPADVNVADRAGKVAAYFRDNAEKFSGNQGADVLSQYDKELSEKMNYLLGYDASVTLFGFMSPTSVLEDGKMFITVVMETISANIGDEIRKRYEKFAAVRKYTAKYE